MHTSILPQFSDYRKFLNVDGRWSEHESRLAIASPSSVSWIRPCNGLTSLAIGVAVDADLGTPRRGFNLYALFLLEDVFSGSAIAVVHWFVALFLLTKF